MRVCAVCNADIEHRPKIAKYCSRKCKDALHYSKHAEERRLSQARYRKAHRSERKEYDARRPSRAAEHRARYQSNPTEYMRHRDSRRGAIGQYSESEWRRLLARHGNSCAYCGSGQEIERDHVIPLSRGGTNYIGNILPACRKCNRSKFNHLLVEWRNLKGR